MVVHNYLLVRVVESDCEAGGEDRLWRWCDASILADSFSRECRLCPFGYNQDFTVDNIGDVRVIEGGGEAVPGIGGGGIGIAKGVRWLRLVAVLLKVNRGQIGILGRLEIECCFG